MASQHVGVVDTKDARHLDLAKVWIREPDLRNRIAVHLHDDISKGRPMKFHHPLGPILRCVGFSLNQSRLSLRFDHADPARLQAQGRSEAHTSELQSIMRIQYAYL